MSGQWLQEVFVALLLLMFRSDPGYFYRRKNKVYDTTESSVMALYYDVLALNTYATIIFALLLIFLKLLTFFILKRNCKKKKKKKKVNL